MSGVTVTLVSPGTFPGGAFTNNSGNDSVFGGSGADTINGGEGDDSIYGSSGNDSLVGGNGNDWLIYAGPNDTLINTGIGDSGTYRVTVDLGAGTTFSSTAAGAHHNDLISGFENVLGTAYSDYLIGDSGANSLVGGGYSDTLAGAAGNDTLDGGTSTDSLMGGLGDDSIIGGTGTDWAGYHAATGAVTVDLVAQSASGADGNDTLSGIWYVRAGNFDDSLLGDNNANTLSGGRGEDTIWGGLGEDQASYELATNAVTIDLAAQTASGADGNDILSSIERAQGGNFNDSLLGRSVGFDLLWGGNGADTLAGGDGVDTLRGEFGNDSLDGGTGVDWISFWGNLTGSSTPVTVNLGAGTSDGVSTLDGQDVFTGFENVQGGVGHDSILADSQDNYLDGHHLNDTMDGGDGNDTLFGSYHNDLLIGSLGNDCLDGYEQIDTASYLAATASVTIDLSGAVDTAKGRAW